jgi:hypothetical protein
VREIGFEVVDLITPVQWEKGGIHRVRVRITIDAFLSLMAWHDDNHLDQLTRALQGRAQRDPSRFYSSEAAAPSQNAAASSTDAHATV